MHILRIACLLLLDCIHGQNLLNQRGLGKQLKLDNIRRHKSGQLSPFQRALISIAANRATCAFYDHQNSNDMSAQHKIIQNRTRLLVNLVKGDRLFGDLWPQELPCGKMESVSCTSCCVDKTKKKKKKKNCTLTSVKLLLQTYNRTIDNKPNKLGSQWHTQASKMFWQHVFTGKTRGVHISILHRTRYTHPEHVYCPDKELLECKITTIFR